VTDLWRFNMPPPGLEKNACFIPENVVLRLSQTLSVFATGFVGQVQHKLSVLAWQGES